MCGLFMECFNEYVRIRPQTCIFIKKDAPTQVFPCKFCNFFKKTLLRRTPPVTASEVCQPFENIY